MNVAGMVTVDVRNTITVSQNVFDSNSTKVGQVDFFDGATGWLTIASLGSQYYVPVKLITHIDPHELFLSVTKEQLQRDYTSPPARTTELRGQGSSAWSVTTQHSGYKGGSVVVDQAPLSDLRNRISTDFTVFTSDGFDLGKVLEYDATTGLMMLGKRPFSSHDVVVPITVVSSVDAGLGEISLIASKTDVERMTPVSLVQTATQLVPTNPPQPPKS
ncbi:MAG: DUF2171 domain-containing protein [Candidatus Dormibacteraeota bacterium]|nr:DUF2171 domain-containing protein [Candidatus Dormibacteraeota bacterium]